ncbi:glycosyltransferase family 39 protein [Thiorhodococcus mannitoliphagus]|uniref:Glycosyltransferase family 39 protein n=1 Tax=Thiorhodococcus mannitoliphagus TaxID=329406 RepID=A0A6P1DTX7_9GAMM|nr:glycosyltransferase family 39 protein [Thiorhodococcus mannitoliphagus]NEX20146.1 glycosyltransferase family 39 protein [Thiorhodococcus mannitoliphagus]
MTTETSIPLGGRQKTLRSIMTSPLLLVLVIALSFFWQLGAVPLYDLDEGAFTEATREMLASGNFITPHRDGEPRYDKPVLIYWAQAASVEWLGFNEFALRLPSAMAATLWVMALWFFVRARIDAETATVAGLVMALCLQVSIIAKAAVADALLNLFIALTFFEIYRYYLQPDVARGRKYIWRAYLWMGLGFLTKGPVAVFFPVVVSFLFFLSELRLTVSSWRTFGRWFRAVFAGDGWLIFLAVAVPWYVAIYLDDGAGFFRSFFLDHNVGRFDGAMHGHGGFPGYYFAILPLILLPFTGWFLSLFKRYKSAWQDPLDRFLWIWFLVVFVVFSFSGTKLPHYLLYGATPLFILMAKHRDALLSRWLAFLPPLLFFAVLALLPMVLDVAVAVADKPHEVALFEYGRSFIDRPYVLAVMAGLVLTILLMRWSGTAFWQALIFVGILQTIFVFGVLVPRVFDTLQTPVKEAALKAKAMDLPTVVYRTSMPSFSVYRDAITPNRIPKDGELVFLRVDKLQKLVMDDPQLELELLYQRGAVALLRVRRPQ